MSSIYGIWKKGKTTIPESWPVKIKAATQWWDHDGQEELLDQGIYLGKTLLKTVPEGTHKLANNSSPFKIIADARLDNRDELNAKLNTSPVDQYSDTDYILLAYKKYGQKCVEHLIGAFAFVIYDSRDHSIFMARDHMGAKPLYYCYNDGVFAFGSEKKSILALPEVDRSPNWEFIMQKVLTYRLKEDQCEYLHIHRLPSATSLTLDGSGNIQTQRYWELDTTKQTFYNNDADYIDEFVHHCRRAVSDRMRNLRNIGTHLSGGLDSSGVTGVAASVAQEANRDLHVFSYTIPKEKEDGPVPFENENPFVMDQVAFSNIKHLHRVEKPLFPNRREFIEGEARIMDGFSASNNYNTEYELQLCAQENDVDVILSGFPGDELVTSFVRPYYLEYLERGSWLKYFTSKHRGKYSFKKLIGPVLLKMSQAIGGPLNPRNAALLYQKDRMKQSKREGFDTEHHMFSPSFLKNHPELSEAFKPPIESQYLYGFPLTLKEYQRNHVCRRHTSARMESENAAGLQFKVEYRYPYTDIRLLQYVLSLPVEQKISKEKTRLIYRKSMTQFVPPSILARDNKQGSLKPMNAFYRKNTNHTMLELYEELKTGGGLSFLDIDKVDKTLEGGYFPARFDFYLRLGVLERDGKMQF